MTNKKCGMTNRKCGMTNKKEVSARRKKTPCRGVSAGKNRGISSRDRGGCGVENSD
jgi:hypothetical protein